MMMKRLLFTLVFSIAGHYLFAQCTPQVFSGPGFLLPDTSQALSPVNPAQLYYQEITTYVPLTAVVNGLQIPIDSAKFEEVQGLPDSLAVWLNIPSNLGWHSGTNGCFVIIGQAPYSAAGNYTPKFSFRIFGLGTSMLMHMEYDMVVLDSAQTSVRSIPSSSASPFVYADGEHLVVRMPFAGRSNLSVTDLQGRLLLNTSMELQKGENRLSSLMSGIKGLVFIRIESAEKRYSQKVFIP
jgi:hypothetical protein